MGKGIAKQFKDKYPDMYLKYRDDCNKGLVRPGIVLLYPTDSHIIANFPTKVNWRYPSKYEWIESGLDYLANLLKSHKIKSIAIPKLGCSNGKLDWTKVKEIILSKLDIDELKDIRIDIYE
jgi:O-acetyl-ADP-ribose deacetylase (regulator of RNase III)